MSSCTTTRRISDDEYLFIKSKIIGDKGKTDISALKKYERISPNKKVLGFRFHLYLYSLANPEKDKFPHSWLKSIGEPPVVYDSILVVRNQENFKNYLEDRGYNNVKVASEVKKKRKKAKAKYIVDLGKPTLVNSVKYSFEDTSITSFVFSDTINSLIKKNKRFDKLLFQLERERIEVYLKNKAFYKFSREYVHYEIHPTKNELLVDVNIKFKQNISGVFDPVSKVRKHKQYVINNVLIIPDKSKFEKLREIDSVEYQQHDILYFGKQIIKPSTLVGANNLLPGSLYSLKNVDKTYTDYSTLGLFRYTNIVFEEIPSDGSEKLLLDCKIDLAMRKRQSYAIDFSLTNSVSDIGIRGGLTYNNFNIFRGGEHFQVGLSGAIESLEHRQPEIDNPMREIGITSKFETPKFLLPFNAERFQRKYKPRTEIQLSYNYQSQPKYTRTIANASFGYNWKGNIYNRHVFHPFDFYLVKLPFQDSAYFKNNFEGIRLENSFTNHSILGLKYSFEFNNQNKKRGNSQIYILYNFESAGLLVNQINKIAAWGADSLLFQVNYFQYIKTDFDFRNYIILSPRDKLVYRIFSGIGLPYGNSKSMPFEKMYYSGGPYSMRAWGERSLGPGSYNDEITYNQLGDIKLEANLEYRFKVIWKMESALFLDAGNIWLLEDVPEQPGTGFNFNTFYKDIAVGVGFGFRFDFSFVLIRTDFGFKLRDPSIYDSENADATKWTFKSPDRNFWDYTFQFGIGYPF